MMVSKGQIQRVRSLERRKERDEQGLFVAEGDKVVRELVQISGSSPYRIQTVFGTANWLKASAALLKGIPSEVVEVTEEDLARLSLMHTPNQALAVVHLPEEPTYEKTEGHHLLLGLDQVQDPGNVGTLIRLADWFGLDGVIASSDTADLYSPKVVQASMGSVFRVPLLQKSLDSFLLSLPEGFPVYSTTLDGEPVYSHELSRNGIILLGNESKGLTGRYRQLSNHKLLIPNYPPGRQGAESLNISLAAAIICSEFRRR